MFVGKSDYSFFFQSIIKSHDKLYLRGYNAYFVILSSTGNNSELHMEYFLSANFNFAEYVSDVITKYIVGAFLIQTVAKHTDSFKKSYLSFPITLIDSIADSTSHP